MDCVLNPRCKLGRSFLGWWFVQMVWGPGDPRFGSHVLNPGCWITLSSAKLKLSTRMYITMRNINIFIYIYTHIFAHICKWTDTSCAEDELEPYITHHHLLGSILFVNILHLFRQCQTHVCVPDKEAEFSSQPKWNTDKLREKISHWDNWIMSNVCHFLWH